MIRKTSIFKVVLLFLFTLVLASLYYMKPFVKMTWNADTSPARTLVDRDAESMSDDNADLVYFRKFARVRNLPTKEALVNLTDKEMHYIYHSYLDNTDFRCKRKLRMGKTGDGGWEVCDDFLYRPITPCIVYSFGINNDFSFDDDVGRVYGCHVYSFDPSMDQKSHNRSDRVSFYRVGISGSDHKVEANYFMRAPLSQWPLMTLTQIKAMLHHQQKTIDIIKMDIEFVEWSVLEDILQQGELHKVRQLLIEFHYDLKPATVRRALPILQKLESLGFQRFHTHMNPYGSVTYEVFPVRRNRCYEVYFANTRLARQKS